MVLNKIYLPFRVKRPILALGSQTKNTICFSKDDIAYLNNRPLDLNHPDDLLRFEKIVKYFLKKQPKIIVYDLHPEYESTKFAQMISVKRYHLSAAQHHHAHIASCMAENNLDNRKVIGVAFDGTGMGDDNTLWGAEFLVCDYSNYNRRAHLKYIPLIGAEIAIWQPWRTAIFWLYLIYQDRMFNLGIDFVKRVDKRKWEVLKKMYDAEFNCPQVSSMGRFFDSVASLVLNKIKVNFEAEAAIELEKLATGHRPQATGYGFKILRDKSKYILDPTPMFKQIIADLTAKESKENIAYRFHVTVAEMVKRVCLILRKETNINRIVLSGGVFQNKVLLPLALDLLYKEGFRVFTHKQLSCSDSSISLGQVAIGNFSRQTIRN
jgi:hydrogenase maturation protein HypF